MPELKQLEDTLYHYYDNDGNCYFFYTWQEAWRFYQKLRINYAFEVLMQNK